MKTALFLVPILLFSFSVFAQTKNFDLATYLIPKGWKITNSSADAISYAITNKQKKSYCQIAVYKSMTSLGSLQSDFEAEWRVLIAEQYKVTSVPQEIVGEIQDGWETKSGIASFEFDKGTSAAMLVTMTGYGKRMSFVILTNSQIHQNAIDSFLNSIVLKIPDDYSPPTAVNQGKRFSISGIWIKSGGVHQQYGDPVSFGNSGYSKDQYQFFDDGTYIFNSKTYGSAYDRILLVRENGSYQINGSNLTIKPAKSVIESWSKKDGTDKFGQLISTKNRQPETVTYQFTSHYFSGIQETNLVLQAEKPTQRDGAFSNNKSFSNAWYYRPVASNNPVIDIPDTKPISATTEPVIIPSVPTATTTASASPFAFTSTNFDDGWKATEQTDWVRVSKGKTVVLIHYALPDIRSFNNLDESTTYVWNTLIAPRYSNIANLWVRKSWYADGGFMSAKYYAEANLTDNATGKKVFVVLYRNSENGGKWLEFICPDKSTFEQQFTQVFAQDGTNWDKLTVMGYYNKFPVAASDLPGKWTDSFAGAIQYVNVHTGSSAGMNTSSSNTEFVFAKDGTYHWKITAANGFVGSINYQKAESNGVFKMPDNWQINFSDIEGKPRTYNASFEAIKGGRILHIGSDNLSKVQ